MNPHYVDCVLCQQSFRMGPSVYNGRYLPVWDDYLCRDCETSNHDGIVAGNHHGFLERLAAKGVTPARNQRGFVRIPG